MTVLPATPLPTRANDPAFIRPGTVPLASGGRKVHIRPMS